MQLRGELGDVHVLEALVQRVGVVEQHLLAQGLVVVARVAVLVALVLHAEQVVRHRLVGVLG